MYRHFIASIKSFKPALKGFVYSLKRERNFFFEVGIAIVVIAQGVSVGLNYIELSIIIIACAAVISAELFNSAIEETWNRLHPEHHEQVGRIKDFSAAAVLVVAMSALAVGVLIFGHHILS